jgi:DNA replication and repair protein RecF
MDAIEVQRLVLTHFKSYSSEKFEMGPGFQVIAGQNGMGKTNVLDALYYLGMCRSYFSLRDKELVRHGEEFFRLEVHYSRGGVQATVIAKVKPGDLKIFEKDKKPYDTLASHIGQIPVVLIAPNDTQLITGLGEERRKFFDQTLCQIDKNYLHQLTIYNRLLLQRNAWLKRMLAGIREDPSMLDTFDAQMAAPAAFIVKARAQFSKYLAAKTKDIYAALSREREVPGAVYKTKLLETNWEDMANRFRSTDMRFGRTTEGLHRDDLELQLDGYPARRFSSQGQLKSFIMALKLAQFEFIAEEKGVLPLLLLDDIFDKLDNERVAALIHYLAGSTVGQVVITDTDHNRVPLILAGNQQPFRTFRMVDSHIMQDVDQTDGYAETK